MSEPHADERRVAVIDTTHHHEAGPETVVGGLTLFERTVRVAARLGATDVAVVGDATPSLRPHRIPVSIDDEVFAPEWELRSDVIYGGEQPPKERMTIRTQADAKSADNMLWDGCRKAVDGIVSRHLNRHISLAISRRIAHTRAMPNHITAITFSLGVAAAVCAAIGGTAAWVAAGVLFQATSVLDGVDGELARVRMDGSVMGEWLDTISDDSSDVLMYGALGLGAYRVGFAPNIVPAELWLALGIAAVVGKLASMFIYYRWLRARGRGDLLAFQWSFEDETSQTAFGRIVANLKYLTKNDFIAFAVMVLGLVGFLPWFLFVAVPGTWIVTFAAWNESR